MTTADFKTAARRIECEEDGLYFTRYFFKQRTGSRMIVAPHHQVIQRTLDRVIDGDIRRLIINVPPGYTKTELATINMMGRGLALNRRARFMHLSYSHNLALLNSSTTRSIVKSAAFQGMWPMALRDDADSKAMWWTEYGGGVYASSAAGQVTGFRAGHMEPGWQGCLILDDPVKPDDAYSETIRVGVNTRFNETIRSRLAIETTPIVVIMQRIHYHDLSGYLLRGGSGEQWHHLNLPVLIDNSEQYSLLYPENSHAIPIEHGLPDGWLWPYKHNESHRTSLFSHRRTAEAQYMQRPRRFNADGALWTEAMVSVTTLFPAFSRTVEVLSGKPFSRPVTWNEEAVPARIREMFGDVDLQGTNLHSFLADTFEEAMAYGLCGILVEHPPADKQLSLAEERQRGLRPYFVRVNATSLLDYDSERVNGQETFTLLRFVETVSERDPQNEFVVKNIEQVRVLNPGRWRIYREKLNETSGVLEWQLHDEGTTSLKKITFVPVYGDKRGFMHGRPPLAELAWLNVEHWQSRSDQQTILHVARVPVLFGKKLGDGPISVGAASAILSEEDEADLRYVEHSGKAIEAGRTDIIDLEEKMRQIGAELLVVKPGHRTVVQTLTDTPSMTMPPKSLSRALSASASKMKWSGMRL